MVFQLIISIIKFPLRNLQNYLILVLWTFSIVREYCNGSYYFALLFAFITQIPLFFTELSLYQHILLFPSLSLLFASISLTRFDISCQIFLVFVHFEFISQIKSGSLYCMIDILFEFISLFLSSFVLKYTLLLIGLNFCACYSISIATNSLFLQRPFNFFSSCLSAFLHTSTKGNHLNLIIFIFSIFLSLPHFPVPVPPQKINKENIKCVIYIIVSIACNFLAISVGLEYHALSLVSDAMMSTCNCVAMTGEIIADIALQLKPSRKFSYGFKRGKIICDFSVTILLIYVSYDLVVSAFTSLLQPPDETAETPLTIFSVSILGLLINTFGIIFLGSLDPFTCKCAADGNSMSVISDFLSSMAVVVSSVFSVFFDINFFDPFVTILISVMILSISVSKMVDLIGILMQNIPTDFELIDFVSKIDERADIRLVKFHGWALDEETNVLCLKLPDINEENYETIFNNINDVTTENKNMFLTCEVAKEFPKEP